MAFGEAVKYLVGLHKYLAHEYVMWETHHVTTDFLFDNFEIFVPASSHHIMIFIRIKEKLSSR